MEHFRKVLDINLDGRPDGSGTDHRLRRFPVGRELGAPRDEKYPSTPMGQ
ncbi:hypothetical protein GCM10009566_60060 [Streptomyces murinus]